MEKFDRKKYNLEWKKENTLAFNVRLFKSTDADIIEAIKKSGNPMATEAKRLIRLGLQFDSQSDSHADATQQK